jgi:hypothetical protein
MLGTLAELLLQIVPWIGYDDVRCAANGRVAEFVLQLVTGIDLLDPGLVQ